MDEKGIRHIIIESQGTIPTDDIREWVLAVNRNNLIDKDIKRAVTLNCIHCQGFDAGRVYECVADGCMFHNHRLDGFILEENENTNQ